MKIKQLKIIKSQLFGPELIINFSDKMTCIMGGRGTGKTTILTLTKWCLTDDTLFSKAELNLIKANLGSGTVEVTLELDNKDYKFIKDWGDSPRIKDWMNNIVNTSDGIFPNKLMDYFSSGSIEQIGTDPFQRMKIIDGAVGSKIDELNRNITIVRAEIDKNQSELFYSREEYKRINQEISQLSNSENALKEAQENLAKSTSNEKEKEEFDNGLAQQKSRQIEAIDLSSMNKVVTDLLTKSMEYNNFIRDRLVELANGSQSKNEKIDRWLIAIRDIADGVSTKIGVSIFDLNDLKNNSTTFTNEILKGHQSEELKFAEIRKKLESNRELYQKVTALTESVTKLSLLKNKLKEIFDKGSSLANQRKQLLEQLKNYYYEKTKNRVLLAESLNAQIGTDVKIAVVPQGDKANFENYLREIISLAKMKVTNEHLLWELSSPNDLLFAINDNKLTELAQQLNLSSERLDTLNKVIHIHDKKFELETIICDDLVNFYLKIDGSDDPTSYRATEFLSLGQRCTTVLPILFSISTIPLVIDQPEDNLDNRFVAETIHKIIKTAKQNRQLTFVTHNPNIPVVADSEHNVFINYDKGQSSVTVLGTVDQVKESIVSLLEGGREAFTQRKICYGIRD